MMDFSPTTAPRDRGEPIVAMINIVFLLLIFFLMTAAIAPPDPFEILPPDAAVEAGGLPPNTLYVGPDAALAFEDARGDAVFDALRAAAPDTLSIRADARVSASDLAALLPRLATTGVTRFDLVTVLP